jgi:hypothetical protein
MKGDFSRLMFDALKHYAGVLHQQGRVWLDSDWNEDVLERLKLLQFETDDIVGACGFPEPGNAFRISPNPAPGAQPDDFLIGGGSGPNGRGYVRGVLCENDSTTASYLNQADFPDPPRIAIPTDGSDLVAIVYLEVWRRLITYLEDNSIREIALGGPDTTTRLKTIAQVKVVTIPSFLKDYNCASVSHFIPGDGQGTLTTLPPVDTQPPDLCRLPDPANYTGRENHLYRVEIHFGGDVLGATGAAFTLKMAQDATLGASTLRLVRALSAAEAGAATRAEAITITDDDGQSDRIAVSAVSGDTITLARGVLRAFTTAKNATVAGGAALFKWSRDNASFAVAVNSVSPDRLTLTLDSLGRDRATQLRQGDIVEICDDVSELGPAHGHLTYLSSDPDPDQLTVSIADALPSVFIAPVTSGGQTSSPGSPPGSPPSSPPTSPPTLPPVNRHLILRRWDGLGTAKDTFSQTATPDMDLGDGIHIHFGGSDLRSGDYWQFSARSTDGSIEILSNAPPAGIRRYRCQLAVVRWTASQTSPPSPPGLVSSPPAPLTYSTQIVRDCRTIFAPLAQPAIHVTGVFTVGLRNLRSALVNDSAVAVQRILTGIDVECDADATPSVLSRAVCYLTVQLPIVPTTVTGGPGFSVATYQEVVLAADATVAGGVIRWRIRNPASLGLLTFNAVPSEDPGLLAKLVVKGNFVWAVGSPTQFLDGDDFGTRIPADGSTALRLPSGNHWRGGDFETWFWLTRQEVSGGPLSFNMFVAVSPQVRGQGTAELVGDILLVGTGGTPTDIGAQVPAYNITVLINTQITNGPGTPAPLSDAVLVIDDPAVLNTAAVNQQNPGPVFSLDGAGVNFNGGDAPNIYRGVISGNQVKFSGVPVDPPGPSPKTRTLRIMNIRANANGVGELAVSPIMATVTTVPALPINNAVQPVAFVTSGAAAFELRNSAGATVPSGPAFTISSSAPGGVNGGLLDDPTFKGAVTSFFVQFNELFGSAFRIRKEGFTAFGAIHNDETGFDDLGPTGAQVIPTLPGQTLPPIGAASSGTRYRITFNDIPPEAGVFVTVRNIPLFPDPPVSTSPTVPPARALFVNGAAGDGSGGAVSQPVLPPTTPEAGGFQIVPLAINPNRGAVAVWECVKDDPAVLENIRFGIVVTYRRTTATPTLGVTTVNGSLAPFIVASGPVPVGPPEPQFRDDSVTLQGFAVTQ